MSATVRLRPAVSAVTIAHTALHGVGADVLRAAFARLPAVDPPESTGPGRPGAFPTVPFPNPEEPGAMDLVVACRREGRGPARPRQRSRRRPAGRGDPRRRRVVAAPQRRRDRLAAGRPHPRPHPRRRPAGGHHAGVVEPPRTHGRRRRGPLRRDLHRVQVDRPGRPRASGAAVRVRVRAGPRVPGGTPSPRQGRHHGGGAVRRARCRGRRAGHHAAGAARRTRRPLRPPRRGRAVAVDGTGRRVAPGSARCSSILRPRSTVPVSSTFAPTQRPTSCG